MSRTVHVPRVSTVIRAALVVVIAAAFDPLVRLIATAGDLDPSFGRGGLATATTGEYGYTSAVAVQPDGKILAAGPDATDLRIVRFNPDGSVDTGFGAGGAVTANLSSEDVMRELPIKILLRPDGRIVVVATFDNFYSAAKVALLQYHPDGAVDSTFGNGGMGVHTLPGTLVYTGDAALQADGGVLVAGYAYFGAAEYTDFTVHRFTASGVIDQAFGPGGFVRTDVGFGDEAFAIALQPDGRFIVAGFADVDRAPGAITLRHFAFVRYMPDGTLDTSFGSDGRVMVDPSLGTAEEAWCHEVIVQPDGRIVAAGAVSYPTNFTDVGVVRLLSNGELDTSFSGDGMAVFAGGSFASGGIAATRRSPSRLALQANGRLVAADLDVVLGIRDDGNLDPDFHGDGIAMIPGPFTDMTLQDDGKIVIADVLGEGGSMRVIRLIADNTPPALTSAAISVQRGTSPRLTIGTATDTSDPLRNLVVAPVAGTVPAGLTFTNFLINATTGAVSAVVTPSCTAETGTFDVQFSITDGGNATTFATVPVEIVVNTGPTLSIGDRTKVEENVFPLPAVLVVTASGGVCAQITVQYSTSDDTATAPADYTATAGTATIDIGQSSATISIPITGGQFPEPDERFFVNLDSPVNATIADGQGVVTILDDDPSLVQFAGPAVVEVLETDEATADHVVTLRLSRLTAPTTNASVRVFTSGTASNGTDYVRLSPEFVHFAPGETDAEIRIGILGDLIEEATESVTVRIGEWSNATIGTLSSVQITIRDDEAAPDTTAPILDAFTPGGPNEAGWHNMDASVRVAASDGGGSGVKSISYTLTGAQTSALIVVPADRVVIPVTAEGTTEVRFFAEDVAGNVAATQSVSVRLDKTAPALVVTSPKDRVYALNEPVTAAYTCADGGSGVQGCFGSSDPGAALDTTSIGAKMFVAIARDLAGNDAVVVVNYTVAVPPSDTDRPIVVGSIPVAANGAGWHKADVAVNLSATDGSGTGVKSISYALSGAQTSSLTVVSAASVSVPIVTEGITTVTFFAEDVAGNVATSQSLTVRLDKTAPRVVITSPEARVYTVHEAAAAAYACTDAGSGIAACTGTTVAGAPIDTAAAGPKTFSATATDAAGNAATATVAYSVMVPPPTFTIRALYDPLLEHTRNSAVPIKLQVENAAGLNLSSAALMVEALAVSSGTEIGPAEEELLADDAGHSNPLGRFRFVADGAYLFNLKTTNLTAGEYVLVVRVAGDAALHALPFLIREP